MSDEQKDRIDTPIEKEEIPETPVARPYMEKVITDVASVVVESTTGDAETPPTADEMRFAERIAEQIDRYSANVDHIRIFSFMNDRSDLIKALLSLDMNLTMRMAERLADNLPVTVGLDGILTLEEAEQILKDCEIFYKVI